MIKSDLEEISLCEVHLSHSERWAVFTTVRVHAKDLARGLIVRFHVFHKDARARSGVELGSVVVHILQIDLDSLRSDVSN